MMNNVDIIQKTIYSFRKYKWKGKIWNLGSLLLEGYNHLEQVEIRRKGEYYHKPQTWKKMWIGAKGINIKKEVWKILCSWNKQR